MVGDFAQTGAVILDPLYTLWLSFRDILPRLVVAIIILIIGYFIALILGHAVRILLEKLGLDTKVKQAQLSKTIGHTHIPAVLGEVTKWYIFIIFFQQAVAILSLGTLTGLLDKFVNWVPNLIAAVLIILFGFAVAQIVEIKMTENSKMRGVGGVAKIIKVILLIMVFVVAVKQIGIEVGLLENSILILLGGFALGVALALGISMGLGLKGDAHKMFFDWKRKL